MRLLAARTVPFVTGARSGVYALGAALLAGLALGTFFAFGALAPSGPVDRSAAPAETDPGGETVVAKAAEAEATAPAAKEPPGSAGRLHAAAVPPMVSAKPAREEQPNLKGLSEIPRELIWNRPPDEEGEDSKPKAFADFSSASEVLPWDAVEPVPFSPLGPSPAEPETEGSQQAAVAPQAPLNLPDAGQVATWVRAKVTEIKGADRTRPLFHFQLWLDPPEEMKRRLVGVAYDFNTPAVRPQTQASSDQASGFRINAGGLACADKIVMTLSFDDGRAQKVVVDGCKLLS